MSVTAPAHTWQTATVIGINIETPNAKTFRLALPEPSRHRAGQHYVVRLTAPDGYSASRSYSIASAPDESNEVELTIERLEDGEVSTFLHDEVLVGDEIDLRGPIGGWFVWDGATPALLVGGGSGVVPLMAMLRMARRERRPDLVRLVVSVRRPSDLYYAGEIAGPETTIVYTRESPRAVERPPGRITGTDIPQPLVKDATAFVCGSPAFADAASHVLVDLGVAEARIRVERFGPSG
jgi:ferredoxin-NADP reductase